jgi:hypothetical protein
MSQYIRDYYFPNNYMLPERKANQRLMKSLVFNTASFAKAFDPISARKKLNRLPSNHLSSQRRRRIARHR